MELQRIFDSWATQASKAYLHKQWLLSKWEVFEEVEWSEDKVHRLVSHVAAGLEFGPGQSLVDLGCGGGWIAGALAGQGREICGVDISKAMLANAVSLLPGVPFLCGDVLRLPFRDGAFDRALCYFVFINFDDTKLIDQAVREISRVLKPGGRALIGQMPDKDGSARYDKAKLAYLERCRAMFPLKKSIRDIHVVPVHRFDRGEILRSLEGSGMSVRFRDSFNPFYLPGEPETVDWRFDIILRKK